MVVNVSVGVGEKKFRLRPRLRLRPRSRPRNKKNSHGMSYALFKRPKTIATCLRILFAGPAIPPPPCGRGLGGGGLLQPLQTKQWNAPPPRTQLGVLRTQLSSAPPEMTVLKTREEFPGIPHEVLKMPRNNWLFLSPVFSKLTRFFRMKTYLPRHPELAEGSTLRGEDLSTSLEMTVLETHEEFLFFTSSKKGEKN